MSKVLIKNGSYRNMPVNNVAFTLVKDYQETEFRLLLWLHFVDTDRLFR